MKLISIPEKIYSDYNGFQFFINLYKQLQDISFSTINIDFRNTIWFEANLCAILGSILNFTQGNFNEVTLSNLNPQLQNILSRNNFLASFQGTRIPDFNDTTIKYRKSKLTDEQLIYEYLEDELVGKTNFPKLSNPAKNEIIRSIFEIFSNAVIHGDCQYVYSCGQLYPRKEISCINFTIVDLGKTIKNNVNSFLESNMTGMESLLWAIKENNTTKPKRNNIPGGLGLKIIRDFIRLNNGKIQMVSSDGYWEYIRGKEESNVFNFEFPGTIVNINFNLNDESFYYLEEEKDEQIIF